MPTLPLTQLDDRRLAADLDNRTFTLTFAQPVPIKDLLLLLVRGTNLSVVPDPAIAGSFIGELKNVTVRQALGLILPPLGLDYAVDGSVIRVFRRSPRRVSSIHYIATERSGDVQRGGDGDRAAPRTVTSTTSTDVFADLTKGVQTLLSEHGAFNVDRKAGLLQVTDFPDRLDRISSTRGGTGPRASTGADRRAIIEVELTDEKAPGPRLGRGGGAVAAGDAATPRVPRAGARPACGSPISGS